jgi:RNA polymerase sigma factor (sigma-70 family)
VQTVTRPLEGERDAFASFVSPHLAVMARVAARLAPTADRDDLVQDALAQAWRRRGTYDERRGTAAAWLCAIVADRARRAARGRHPVPLAVLPEEPAAAADLERALDVERAVARLSRRQREAVDLHYFAGLSVAETAAVMRCSPGTVKSTLSDARSRLTALLEETS